MQAGGVVLGAHAAGGKRDRGQNEGVAFALRAMDCRVGVWGTMWLLVEHVGEADGDEAADDEEHAEPLEPGQPGAEEDRREDAGEDDHSPSQHLRNLY